MRYISIFVIILLTNCIAYCSLSDDDDLPPQREIMKVYPIDPNWIEITPDPSPPPRYDHGMVYFPPLEGIVLFGGRNCDNGKSMNDTWLFKNDTWLELHPSTSPSPRFRFGMSYDNFRKRIVLYGGTYSNFETWEFDGNNWTKINTSNHPTSLSGHAMTYFPEINKTVLFGGNRNGYLNETWAYDGINWEKQVLLGNVPEERKGADMIYDPENKTIFLFGGHYGVVYYNDSWTFDGTNWTKIISQHKPPTRALHKMTYNQYLTRVLLFGGVSYYNDTWKFDNNDWAEVDTVNKPSKRAAMAIAFYPSSLPSVILFGGVNVFEDEPYTKGDTWKYVFLSQGNTPSISKTGIILTISILSIIILIIGIKKKIPDMKCFQFVSYMASNIITKSKSM